MATPVFLAEQAYADIDQCWRWWSLHRSEEQAQRWHAACERAIDSLPIRAAACSLTSESASFPCEVRQLTFGAGRRRTHRIVFTIRPGMIYVLRVQHLAQQELSIDDL